jgi:hypothetical protein
MPVSTASTSTGPEVALVETVEAELALEDACPPEGAALPAADALLAEAGAAPCPKILLMMEPKMLIPFSS